MGLTRHGRLLWNFEALLRQVFKNGTVSVSRPENFSCAGDCPPLSQYTSRVPDLHSVPTLLAKAQSGRVTGFVVSVHDEGD